MPTLANALLEGLKSQDEKMRAGAADALNRLSVSITP